ERPGDVLFPALRDERAQGLVHHDLLLGWGKLLQALVAARLRPRTIRMSPLTDVARSSSWTLPLPPAGSSGSSSETVAPLLDETSSHRRSPDRTPIVIAPDTERNRASPPVTAQPAPGVHLARGRAGVEVGPVRRRHGHQVRCAPPEGEPSRPGRFDDDLMAAARRRPDLLPDVVQGVGPPSVGVHLYRRLRTIDGADLDGAGGDREPQGDGAGGVVRRHVALLPGRW